MTKQLLGSLELNRIYQQDCIEGMKFIPDGSVDLIVTDPPYGINLTPQRSTSKFKGERVTNDDTLDWLPSLVTEYYRVLKDNGVAYVFCNWQKYDIFKQAFEKEFTIKNCIVWDKDWFGLGNNWRPNHEFILLISKGKFKTKSNNLSNIIKYRKVAPQKLLHSCEKPVSLLRLLISESSEVGDIVLDTFGGSGSTFEAAALEGRRWIGFETEPKYVEIANKRLDSLVIPQN